jgi:cyclopropane fatty-acyl-phospholipid synthase-like methyltransferase
VYRYAEYSCCLYDKPGMTLDEAEAGLALELALALAVKTQ